MSRLTIDQLEIGSKVHYQPEHYGDTFENGIVKETRTTNGEAVWVVYHCNEDWENYQSYTSAKTNIRDLKLGWGEPKGQADEPEFQTGEWVRFVSEEGDTIEAEVVRFTYGAVYTRYGYFHPDVVTKIPRPARRPDGKVKRVDVMAGKALFIPKVFTQYADVQLSIEGVDANLSEFGLQGFAFSPVYQSLAALRKDHQDAEYHELHATTGDLPLTGYDNANDTDSR